MMKRQTDINILEMLSFYAIFAQNDCIMQTSERVQTILRLSPSLMEKVRRQDRGQGRSVNSYVEHLLEADCMSEFPHIGPDYQVSDEIRSLACCSAMPSPETISADPRLAGILGL